MVRQFTAVCLILLSAVFIASGLPGNLGNFPSLRRSGDEASKFIVGGRKASEGQFPYLVSLRTAWGFHMCGGAILNSRWVLSAAHCIVFVEIPEFVAGALKSNEGGTHYAIGRSVMHENYDFQGDPFIDDICLLQSNRTIEFNQLVQPVPINRSRYRWRGPGVIAGWGWTEGGNHLNPDNFFPVVSEDLNYIEVTILSHFECTWRLSGWAVFLRLDHICTFARNNVGVCTFDSGSPVVADGELVGVVSFVIPCALNFPDWGPRVSSYSRWIDRFIGDLS